MISIALRTDIEAWAAKRDEKLILKMAREGTLTKEMVRCYIANATWMIRRTPGHIEKARDRARLLGDHRLADHYAGKLAEEIGHAAWGEADRESFTRMSVAEVNTPTPSFVELARFLDDLTENGDPCLFLNYLAFTEYTTVILCPELLGCIEERCGVPRSSMTIIDNHIELDRDHAEEGFGVIDDLVPDPSKLRPMRETMAALFRFFDRFCVDVTEVHHVDSDPVSEREISAA